MKYIHHIMEPYTTDERATNKLYHRQQIQYQFDETHQMEVTWKSLENNKEAQRTMSFSQDDAKNLKEQSKKSRSVKTNIETKKTEYINGFTVHGLTRVLTTSKFESVFWLFILLCGISLASYIIHERLTKYYKYEIFTEISSKINKKNSFPAVTFCEANFLVNAFFSYCGKNVNFLQKFSDKPCPISDGHFKHIYTTVRGNQWSNGFFNFTRCRTWGGKQCANQMYLISSVKYNHSCVTWNYQGDFDDSIYGHVELVFHFIDPANNNYTPVLYAIPHDPEVKEIDLTKKVHIDPKKVYDIKIEKSTIKRLPHPFPSNCTFEKHGDIFPGKYSRRGCIESHNYINMFKECGDTLDYVRNFIPKSIRKQFGKRRSISEVKSCMFAYSLKEADNIYDCPFPCESIDLSVLPTFHEEMQSTSPPRQHTYYVNIQLEHVDTVRTIEEKELYSWYQMACEIGGFVGLVIGASLISCIEVFACLVLVVLHKCF